jgi:hypothetical protein
MGEGPDFSISAPGGNRRLFLVAGVAVVLLAGLFLFSGPIPQNSDYHSFADPRSFLSIPNFFNVASNLGFLAVGIIGTLIARNRAVGPMSTSWLVFFAGVALTAFGSGYYHLDPANETLMWDRIPMTLGFAGLFIAVAGECFDTRAEKLLIPSIIIGIGSVVVWRSTGDLRLYVWVQAMPLITVPAMILLGERRFTHSHLLVIAVLIYGFAKLFEVLDLWVFDATGNTVSGHTMKHLAASIACLVVAIMLVVRADRSRVLLSDAKG